MSTNIETHRLIATEKAYRYVHLAYQELKACGAIHAAARVKACLKSVEGAVRHARGLDLRGEEAIAKMKKIRVHRRKKRQRLFNHDHTARAWPL